MMACRAAGKGGATHVTCKLNGVVHVPGSSAMRPRIRWPPFAAQSNVGARPASLLQPRPWRFVIIRGNARMALGNVLSSVARLRDPQDDGKRFSAKAMGASVLIAICARAGTSQGAEVGAGDRCGRRRDEHAQRAAPAGLWLLLGHGPEQLRTQRVPRAWPARLGAVVGLPVRKYAQRGGAASRAACTRPIRA